MKAKVTVSVSVSKEAVERALQVAQTAIGYWGTIYVHAHCTYVYEGEACDGKALVVTRPRVRYRLRASALAQGLKRMATDSPGSEWEAYPEHISCEALYRMPPKQQN